jgi:hypothetical protein
MIAAGVVIGAGASMWTTQFTGSLLYGVEPRDPVTLAPGCCDFERRRPAGGAAASVACVRRGSFRRSARRMTGKSWVKPKGIAAIPDCVAPDCGLRDAHVAPKDHKYECNIDDSDERRKESRTIWEERQAEVRG